MYLAYLKGTAYTRIVSYYRIEDVKCFAVGQNFKNATTSITTSIIKSVPFRDVPIDHSSRIF